jgi:hypothetical protein
MQMTGSSAALFFGILCLTTIGISAQGENYARVCAATIEPDIGEMPLTADAAAGPEKKLFVHLDANTECVAVVVPLVEKSWRLANGWRPQLVALGEWDARTVPSSKASWSWNKSGDPFELWILFFKKDAAGLDELKKLVTAMQNTKPDDNVLSQQTRKLQEMLSSRMAGTPQVTRGAKARTELVGGVLRNGEFPWHDYSEKVILNDAREGIIVIRHSN